MRLVSAYGLSLKTCVRFVTWLIGIMQPQLLYAHTHLHTRVCLLCIYGINIAPNSSMPCTVSLSPSPYSTCHQHDLGCQCVTIPTYHSPSNSFRICLPTKSSPSTSQRQAAALYAKKHTHVDMAIALVVGVVHRGCDDCKHICVQSAYGPDNAEGQTP